MTSREIEKSRAPGGGIGFVPLNAFGKFGIQTIAQTPAKGQGKSLAAADTDHARLAQTLARFGLSVFPCEPDKKPVFGCKWRDVSTNDPRGVEALWRANPDALPAIDCGKSSIVVVDLDCHEGAENGVAHFAALECENGSLDFTPRISTPSGGTHLYFRQPAHGEPIGNSTGDLPLGVDVRGRGGYVVAPGVTMPDGRRYAPAPYSPRLSEVLAMGLLAPIDGWLLGLVRPAPKQRENTAPPRRETNAGNAGNAYAQAAIYRECSAVANAGNGGRNGQLNKSAFSLGQLVGGGELQQSEVVAALLVAAYQCGLPRWEANATIRSGLKKGKDNPRQRPAPRVAMNRERAA
jgi:hypothetical protein